MPIRATSLLGALSLLQLQPKPIHDWGYVAKPLFDYVAATFCILFFAPLMLCIAIAIKLNGPGPVFFRQRRHGFNHRIIDIYKFRSMTVAENGERIDQARKNDPRVTRVGKFLRRTSLDELPQLFNVIKGDMNIVGPRPERPTIFARLRQDISEYPLRQRAKPGITGWAQVNLAYDSTIEDVRKKVDLDLEYLRRQSVIEDVRIMLRTVPVMLFKRGGW